MIHFPEIPAVKSCGFRGDSEVLCLTEDYHFKGGYVPKSFKTDGVSVWRALWRWFHPKGKLFAPAVKHDFGYYIQDKSRKEYDLEMLEDMKDVGAHVVRRQVAYRAVRAFGWRAWKKNQRHGMSHFWHSEATAQVSIT